MIKSVAGVICLIDSLEDTIKFYKSLGFEFKKQVPGISATAYLNWFWIEFLLQDKVITEEFKEDTKISPKGAGQYLHINTEDVDAYYDALLQKGLQPSAAPQDFPWGHREFVISDPTGYKLVFFSKRKPAKL